MVGASVCHVTFGPSSSSFERIGAFCFAVSGLVGLETPPSVRAGELARS